MALTPIFFNIFLQVGDGQREMALTLIFFNIFPQEVMNRENGVDPSIFQYIPTNGG